MVETLRNTAPLTFRISEITDRAKAARAADFDVEKKGYLTWDQAVAWYQYENHSEFPDLWKLAAFLGKPAHEMHQGYVDTWQAIQFTSSASQWRGAFSIPALKDEHGNIPAGNARTGRLIGPVWDPSGDGTRAVDQTLFLFDLDLTDKKTVRDHFEQVTLVIGPKSFPKPYPGAPFGDAVELPMTIYVVDGYPNYTRFGPSGWVPGRKLLCAQVDTADLRALAGDARSLQYYGRIALDGDRTAFINGAGKAYRNFELPVADLASAGEV